MGTLRHITITALLLFASGAFYACGSSNDSKNNGGGTDAAAGSGGTSGSGGSNTTGGTPATGGMTSTGGTATGGNTATGGSTTSGGTTSTGGTTMDAAAGSGGIDASAGSGGSGGTDGGAVSGCRTRNDCPASAPVCNAATGQCVECIVGTDCAQTEECTNGVCIPLPQCTTSLDCIGLDAGTFAGRTICDQSLGVCVDCMMDTDCESSEICVNETCALACNSDNDCTSRGLLCDQAAGACVQCLDSNACTETEHCADQQCVPDVCVASVTVCDGAFLRECNAEGSGFARSVDCSPDTCVETANGAACVAGADAGAPSAQCTDNVMNGSETAVDCGGSECPPCGSGDACSGGSDCQSGVCSRQCFGFPLPVCGPFTCQAASCNDGIQNDGETDIDCGGDNCSACLGGRECVVDTDCLSNDCQSGLCTGPACDAPSCPACLNQFEQRCCTAMDACGCYIAGVTTCQ